MLKKGKIGLLGLNGAGKSTMLSMIPAYQIPTTGLLRVFGREFGKYAWLKDQVTD